MKFFVIKSQRDLNDMMEKESGIYYISMSGQLVSFEGTVFLTKIRADERLFDLAVSQSEAIADSMVKGRKSESVDLVTASAQTYLVPFRIH